MAINDRKLKSLVVKYYKDSKLKTVQLVEQDRVDIKFYDPDQKKVLHLDNGLLIKIGVADEKPYLVVAPYDFYLETTVFHIDVENIRDIINAVRGAAIALSPVYSDDESVLVLRSDGHFLEYTTNGKDWKKCGGGESGITIEDVDFEIDKALENYTDTEGMNAAIEGAVEGKASTEYVDEKTAGLASEEYVNQATEGLASEEYVNQKTEGLASTEYVDEKTQGFATEEYVDGKVEGLATTEYVDEKTQGFATEEYVNQKTEGLASEEFVNEAVSGLASTEYVDEKCQGFATEEFVNEKTANLASKGYVDDSVANLASKTYVDDSVEGLASEEYVDQKTEGLASTEYVDEKTEGLATTEYVDEKIQGLASEEYVDSKIDEKTEGLASKGYVDDAVANLASKTYVDDAVEGLASEEYVDQKTEGLATTEYVDEKTEGLASEEYVDQKTEGLASKEYVDTTLEDYDTSEQVDSKIDTAVEGLAPINNPTFTGTVSVPTPLSTSNDDTAASTAYVTSAVDTLKQEFAGALHFKGVVANLEELDAIEDPSEGDTYQVLDAGEGKENAEYAWNGQTWVELGTNIDLSAYMTIADAELALQQNLETAKAYAEEYANSIDIYNICVTKGFTGTREEFCEILTELCNNVNVIPTVDDKTSVG